MQMVKVYDKNGKHVDSFKKDMSALATSHEFANQVKYLNSKGFYVRRQFSKSGKTLMRSF